MERSVTGFGEIWSLIGIVLVGVALAIGFWIGVAWSVVIQESIGVPLLLAGRHPGYRKAEITEQEIRERLRRRIEQKLLQDEGITPVGLRAAIRDLVRELEGEGVGESIDEYVKLMGVFAFAID